MYNLDNYSSYNNEEELAGRRAAGTTPASSALVESAKYAFA
jgi:hypothetical protein